MSNESKIELELALDRVTLIHTSARDYSFDENGALQYRFRDTMSANKAAAMVAEIRIVQSELGRIQR